MRGRCCASESGAAGERCGEPEHARIGGFRVSALVAVACVVFLGLAVVSVLLSGVLHRSSGSSFPAGSMNGEELEPLIREVPSSLHAGAAGHGAFGEGALDDLVERITAGDGAGGEWRLQALRGEMPGDLQELREVFRRARGGPEGDRLWLAVLESIATDALQEEPEFAANLMFEVGSEWGDLGKPGEALRVWREVAEWGVLTAGTVDANRMLAWWGPMHSGDRAETNGVHLEAMRAADRAVAVYEELVRRDAPVVGQVSVTNALMFGERAAKEAGQAERRVEYALRLASDEFESARPPQGRFSDFVLAGRALRDAGRLEESEAYFDEAARRLRAEGMRDRYVQLRRERLGVGRMDPGVPEKIDALESIWQAEDLEGFELELVSIGRELASDLSVSGQSDRALEVMEMTQVMYEGASLGMSAEALRRTRARWEYARVLAMRADEHAMRGEFGEAAAVVDRMIAAFPDAENMAELIEDRERLLAEAAEARAGEGAGAGE